MFWPLIGGFIVFVLLAVCLGGFSTDAARQGHSARARLDPRRIAARAVVALRLRASDPLRAGRVGDAVGDDRAERRSARRG